MEQNENIMDNGFEYFEEQRKYATIDEKIEKQADKFAKVSQRILVVEAIEVYVGIVLPAMNFDSSFMIFFIGVTGTLVLISHLVSLGYAIAGYKIKKTKNVKIAIMYHKVIPFVCLAMLLLFLVAAYIMWSLIHGFLPEKISFFDWLI